MLINAEHLSLSLNGREVLKDVSLHLEQGEIYGLLGPNGAGKSTSIAVILGLYPPGSGQLRLFEQAQGDPLALRRRIGVMPEQGGFYEWMTPRDYLIWYAGLFGGMQEPLGRLLRLVGLWEQGNRPIGQFSHGTRQRLALARALLHGPELVILDEPTDGLDPRGRRDVHDLLRLLAREQGVGILLCTHLLDDVDRLCDRVGILARGRTLVEGSLRDLLAKGEAGLRFRVRLERPPRDRAALPPGMALTGEDRGWWYLRVDGDHHVPLPNLWEELLVGHGWPIVEIHAEGGGLESLYLQRTAEAPEPREEVPA